VLKRSSREESIVRKHRTNPNPINKSVGRGERGRKDKKEGKNQGKPQLLKRGLKTKPRRQRGAASTTNLKEEEYTEGGPLENKSSPIWQAETSSQKAHKSRGERITTWEHKRPIGNEPDAKQTRKGEKVRIGKFTKNKPETLKRRQVRKKKTSMGKKKKISQNIEGKKKPKKKPTAIRKKSITTGGIGETKQRGEGRACGKVRS